MENPLEPMSAQAEITTEKIREDLQVLLRDAEALIKATAADMNDRTKEARARLSAALDRTKATVQELERKTVATAKATDRVVREHPYEFIGVAFGVGVLIGFLAGRK